MAAHAVGHRSRPKDDDDGMDGRGPAPLRAGDPGDGAAGHARRIHPVAAAARLVDARGAV